MKKKLLKIGLSIGIIGTITAYPNDIAASSIFSDLSTNHWAESAVKQAVEKKYITGYEDGTFRPNNQVTRAEFAAMLSRSIPKEASDVKEQFSDVSDSYWGKEAIEKGIELGFIDPADYQNNQFHPSQPMTRAELSKWMAKGLNSMNGEYGEVVKTLANSPSTLIPIPEFYKGGVHKADLPYIGVAMGTGLVNGYEDGSFKPNGKTTRAEVAAILIRLVNLMEKQPSSFSKLNELVEVAKTGTNLITLTDYAYGQSKDLSHVINKPITFTRNNSGVAQIHRLIVTDATKEGDSIYHNMFFDERTVFGNEHYNVYSEISFTANKDIELDSFMQGTTQMFLDGINLYGLNPQVNYGVNTNNPYDADFVKGKTKRIWSHHSIEKVVQLNFPFHSYGIKTDDGSNSSFMLKQ